MFLPCWLNENFKLKLVYINSQELQRMATKSEIVTGDFVIKKVLLNGFDIKMLHKCTVLAYTARQQSLAENGYFILIKK